MICEKWKANPRWLAERGRVLQGLLYFRGKGMNYL